MSADSKRIALDVLDWMWGTVQGAFNEKMDVSQIITDAVIGMIPLVGDVTAVRDLIAISLGLAGDPAKREDKMQWMLLVVFVFALIPVFGGVVKGVGRLALKVTDDVAKNTEVLKEVVTFLNRIGHGNAPQWFKTLDVTKHQKQVLERFNALMDTLVLVCQRVKAKLGGVLPESLLGRLDSWAEGFKKVKDAGGKMIPEGIKELHAKLQRLQQLTYKGEWYTVTPGAKNATREAEARLVDESAVAAERGAYGGWKQNRAKASEDARDLDEIAKVYQPREGYLDLKAAVLPTAFEEKVYVQIAAFSGPIKAGKVQGGEYILRIHQGGSKQAAGAFWIRLPAGVTDANWREFLKNGKEWRELYAVLEEFSKNGSFSICRVKPNHSVNAWEGKAAEQFGMTNPGQHLPGGASQLAIEAWSKGFEDAVDWVVKEAKTGWTDLAHVGYADRSSRIASAARVQRLQDEEEQSKRPALAGAH